MIQVGDYVTLARLPEWVETMPEETQRIFRFCVGRAYPVIEIDMNGLFVLDVSSDVDERFGGFMNDIRVEREHLSLLE